MHSRPGNDSPASGDSLVDVNGACDTAGSNGIPMRYAPSEAPKASSARFHHNFLMLPMNFPHVSTPANHCRTSAIGVGNQHRNCSTTTVIRKGKMTPNQLFRTEADYRMDDASSAGDCIGLPRFIDGAQDISGMRFAPEHPGQTITSTNTPALRRSCGRTSSTRRGALHLRVQYLAAVSIGRGIGDPLMCRIAITERRLAIRRSPHCVRTLATPGTKHAASASARRA
jgi:hypothetical protein